MDRMLPVKVLAIGLAVLTAKVGAQEVKGDAEGVAGVSWSTNIDPGLLREEGTAGLQTHAALRAPLPIAYRFSGVTDDGEQGSANRKEATSVTCTNTSVTNETIEVEVIQWNGTDTFVGSVDAPPQRTFTFSTQNTTIFFDDVILGGVPGTDAIFQGHGLVRSTNPKAILCSAQILDPLNYPPLFIADLEMVRNAGPAHRYRFSGVSDDGEQGSANRKEATEITCTNGDSQDSVIQVYLYQWDGTLVGYGGVNAPPHRTFTFSTQNSTIFFDDVILGGVPGTDAIFQGYGVITGERPSLFCTAMVLDPLNYPPVFASRLQLESDRSFIFGDGFETETLSAWSGSLP